MEKSFICRQLRFSLWLSQATGNSNLSIPLVISSVYPPYEGPISANQNDRKLDLQNRNLKGNHSILDGYFDKCVTKIN